MIDLSHRHPKPDAHFIIIRGKVADIERIGITHLVTIELVAALDRRLWAYRKLILHDPTKLHEVILLLQEYLVPIICINCPDAIKQCLADIERLQRNECD